MSSSIWTRCADAAEIGRLRARPWRVVEAQHVVSTRRLVDDDAEQRILEEMLETGKPPLGAGESRLHYLLSTPFRYPPLRHGSRFGTRAERGIWYGAVEQRTAFAESAYYRLLFLEGTGADLGPLRLDVSAFTARIEAVRGIDLTREPFRRYRSRIASKVSYVSSQPLGRAMRRAGVEAFLYPSARDAEGGDDIGVFTPRVFASPRPSMPETWYCVATREAVEYSKRDPFRRAVYRFPATAFHVRGTLPAPAA